MRLDYRTQRAAGRALAVGAIVLLAGAVLAPGAHAQVRQRYSPARPTVSPYLNLLRENRSPVPNYYSLVRPQLQQFQFEQETQQIQLLQNQELTQLRTNLLRTQEAAGPATGSSSWFQQPSSRSQFQNTSRYYSRAGGGR
ncbi:hypothetical protein [Botrimarina sp.]|uniref:hypothetical protein n=1 Tax=Botrimarina sp. TaxID=2795802 RepID=UPI0032EEB454